MPRILVSVSIPPELYNEFMALFNGNMKLSKWFVAQMREVVAHEKALQHAEMQKEAGESE